jgi:L-threonylcarbamoyladenylate synthase
MSELEQAVRILKKGGVVVYPTDTAYGMAVDATNFKAVEKLFKLKGRNFKNPIHVIFPDTDWLRKMVIVNTPALKLMNAFLPGPLTLVLPLFIKTKSFKKLSADTKTLGIRLPDNKTALELVEAFGKPITTTSANISGMPTCYSTVEIKKQFEKSQQKPDFYLESGKLKKTKPSTVVSLIKDVKILRPGPITETQIKKALE